MVFGLILSGFKWEFDRFALFVQVIHLTLWGIIVLPARGGWRISLAYSDVLFNTFRTAGLSSHLEVGSHWGQDCSRTCPADILVTNWDNGISVAF